MQTDIPDTAFQFRAEPLRIAPVEPGKSAGPRKCSGVCYSGDMLEHQFWGQVIFDLATTSAPDPTPLLIGHDRDQRAGFATLSIDPATGITVADGTLLNNTAGLAVATESDQGFPWQMSVHIEPGSTEELKAGITASVNGRTVTGPCAIWRNNLIREVSFTPTGVDANTSAVALSAGTGARNPTRKESKMPTPEELQTQIDDLKAGLKAGLKASNDALAAAERRATDAEGALSAVKREARMGAVKDLFQAIGREFSDAAAKPYLGMDDATFSAVAGDMKAGADQKAVIHARLAEVDGTLLNWGTGVTQAGKDAALGSLSALNIIVR